MTAAVTISQERQPEQTSAALIDGWSTVQ